LNWKRIKSKGTESFPSSFNMMQENTITSIEKLVNQIIADRPEVFLISIKIKPTNNIKVYLDADNGLPIDTCIKINRAMYKQIEELNWYPDGNFSLEVSSAGVDEPLKMTRQYLKNIGRNVEVILNDETRLEGKLASVDEQRIVVTYTEGKNKKATIVEKQIDTDNIKQIKVLVTF